MTVCQGLACQFVNQCLQSDTPGSRSTVVLLYSKTRHLLLVRNRGKQYFVILTSLCLASATFPTLDPGPVSHSALWWANSAPLKYQTQSYHVAMFHNSESESEPLSTPEYQWGHC